MKIGIATCADYPHLTPNDRLFTAVLESHGIDVAPFIWNDPLVRPSDWDAIVVRSVWDYHKHIVDFENWITEIEKASIHLVNSPQTIRWNLNKSYLLELSREGISCVPSVLIRHDSSVNLDQIKNMGWTDVVIKPTISATAFLTFRSSVSDPALASLIEQVQKQSNVLIQPFVSSVDSEGEVSLIFFKGQTPEYSHSVLKRPRRGDFRVQSDFGGSQEAFTVAPMLIEFAAETLKKIPGDWTFARVDVVDWSGSPLLGEVELIEPDLFLTAETGKRFAEMIMARLTR